MGQVLPCSHNPGSFGAMKRVRRTEQLLIWSSRGWMRVCVKSPRCVQSKAPWSRSQQSMGRKLWGILLFLFAYLVLYSVYRCVFKVCPGTSAQRKGFLFAVFHMVVALFLCYRSRWTLTVVGSNTTDGQRVSGQLHKNSSHSWAARAACDLCLWDGVVALLLNTSCCETLWFPFSPLVMVLPPEGLSTTPGLGARAACCPSCSIFQCFIWFREVW